ncbi:MAG TPA: DUF1569 domain-containing protein [Chitinophagaceae bacterium]|jgi:Protein of unknown function (DUF1569)|nr:DUF1569 domain-containing protein [Chitinophagaceae bacterium]
MMKTVFDKTTREEITGRINSLDETSVAQWGKMNVDQVIKHCSMFDEMVLGRQTYKRVFIGLVIGKIALKNLLKNEKPLGKSLPTFLDTSATESEGIAAAKRKWIGLVEEYAGFSNTNFVHPFFGKMTKDQIGYFVYKHTDHHLRQFNS